MLSMENSPVQCQSEEHMRLCCSTSSVPKYLSFTQAHAEKPAMGWGFPFSRDEVQIQHFNFKICKTAINGNVYTIVWPINGNYAEKFTAFFLSFF